MTSYRRAPRVSAKAVAAEAGVSVMSVSNAFNRPEKLSPERRAQILEVANRLGYFGPDPAGRSLRTGRVGAIGLMLTGSLSYAIDDPGAVLFLRGIAEVGEFAEVALTLVPSSDAGPALVRSAAIDGLIVYALPEGDPAVAAAVGRRLPIVMVDGPSIPGLPILTIADRDGAASAARHLLELGHRRFAILADRLAADGRVGCTGPERGLGSTYLWARNRIEGYLGELATAGIDAALVPIQEAGGFSAAESRAAAAALLDRADVTAILASTDVLALAAIEEAEVRGLSIGRDLSVTGFDDLPVAEGAGLTTLRYPIVERGRMAAEMLLSSMRGEHPADVVVPAELVVRRSSGAATR